MGAACLITHGVTGSDWDPTTGPVIGELRVVFKGPCRVQYATTVPRHGDAAGQLITERTVLVALPRSAPTVTDGARVYITAVDDDGATHLVGRVLTVQSVNRSSLSWEQDLTCTDDHDNQPGV